ncbi:MAG TPA: prolipoprotein diacylglyceryl transferase family protein, partial [Casimicrobiaceae bacterium]|nr:prolipoprotein diacylglyceryl transferase family protein [Casimicrobiaceae bacterium]
MLVHPQFDPVAIHLGPFDLLGFHLGPFAIRWYGLMYLLGFVLFVVLGRKRARQNLLTGWHPRDVDDMLFFGVFGVIL